MVPQTYISLFSGVGGGDLACQWLLGWQCVCYVEIDEYCQRVLRQRIADGLLDDAPIWDDAKTFDGRPWRGRVDCVTGGPPCQPFSLAGKREGESDERNLWPAAFECIRQIQPRCGLLENVPGLISCGYFAAVLGTLADCGYDAEWGVLSAADVGAPHIRERLWIYFADTNGVRSQGVRTTAQKPWPQEQFERLVQAELRISLPAGSSGGVAYRYPNRVDRLRALGNGQVPLVAATAWRLLKGE